MGYDKNGVEDAVFFENELAGLRIYCDSHVFFSHDLWTESKQISGPGGLVVKLALIQDIATLGQSKSSPSPKWGTQSGTQQGLRLVWAPGNGCEIPNGQGYPGVRVRARDWENRCLTGLPGG